MLPTECVYAGLAPINPHGKPLTQESKSTMNKEISAKEGFVSFRGYRVWYRIVGDRERPGKLPLLCLHGGRGQRMITGTAGGNRGNGASSRFL